MQPLNKTRADKPATYMARALSQARAAARRGEVPVGAVVVYEGQVIAAAANAPVRTHDPTAHAEIRALREAAAKLGNYRLTECSMYVSLEPCAMCASAVLQARLQKLVYAAPEPRTGAAGSVLNLFTDPRLNHHTELESGLLASESQQLLREFFKVRRGEKAKAHQPLRQDALRTPDVRFRSVSPAPMLSHYWTDLDGLDGLRLHGLCFQDDDRVGEGDVMCLHGAQSWSQEWHALFAGSDRPGHRVVCPDLVGFGRSDKPKRAGAHSLVWHAKILDDLIRRIGFDEVLVLTHPDMWSLALELMRRSERIREARALSMPALSPDVQNAPFPDQGYRAGPRSFGIWGLPNDPKHSSAS